MEKETIIQAIHNYARETGQRLNPKAVLFDMDGVLYDSMRFHAQSWMEIAARHHLQAEAKDFYLWEGQTGAGTINALMQRTFHRDATEAEKQDIYAEKAVLFTRYNDGSPMPGAADVLREVCASGLQRVIVTGSGQRSLLDKLEHSFPGCFSTDRMVTAFDVKIGKPHPEPYLMGLQKAGVQANEAIVVENAPMGVHAGVAAGIFTIAVNTGPLADADLQNEGAHLLFPSMDALAHSFPLLIDAVHFT